MTSVLVVVVLVPQPLKTSMMLAPTNGRVMAMMAVLMVKRRRRA